VSWELPKTSATRGIISRQWNRSGRGVLRTSTILTLNAPNLFLLLREYVCVFTLYVSHAEARAKSCCLLIHAGASLSEVKPCSNPGRVLVLNTDPPVWYDHDFANTSLTQEKCTAVARTASKYNGDTQFADAYFGMNHHPFESIFVKVNREEFDAYKLHTRWSDSSRERSRCVERELECSYT